MSLSKAFDSSLGKNMCKAGCQLGGVGSSNPHHQRGWQLCHHGGGVCCVLMCFVCPHVTCNSSVRFSICEKVPEHNPKLGL
jgi:hypothetical protein